MSTRHSKGFTLVELMVGSAIGLLVVAIIGGLYLSSKQMTRVNESIGRLQENGRFTIQTLDDDIRMAGFRGCAGASVSPVNVLGSTAYPYQYDAGIAGYHGDGAAWTPALDATIAGLTPAPLPGGDVVTIRRIEGTSGLQLTAGMSDGNAALQVGAGSAVAAGDILMVADCTASAIFQATGVSSGAVSHDVAIGTPGNGSTDLGHAFRTDATLYRLVTRTYYIAPSANKPGTNSIWVNNVPSYDGTTQPIELVEGAEKLLLVFGEDLDGDRAANRYVTADGVTNWSNVVSAKLMVVVATTRDNMATMLQPYTFNDTTTTPTDKRLRSSLVSVVTLRNRVP